ncbi:MAG: diguanylate cyclase, partial [Desulfobulbaceae bacterium]|nr:diguanylate cyclase [Desulfobulbaceae bacterium]
DIPIIFVTAIGKDDKQIFKGYETGAVDYLFKPLDADILKSKVNVFLEMHRQKEALNLANQELQNANEKILEQQKGVLAEERLNVLLQMAGATAHELSQPLTALLFGINILEMDHQDPERRLRHIADIKKAGQRISEIVKKIKSINRYELTAHDRDHDVINLDQTLKILHIEDDDAFAHLIRELLEEDTNIAITRARGIAEGLETFRHDNFDMIFLNHLLPDGTGMDFLTHLGTLVLDIPTVLTTDHDEAIFTSQLLRAGAYDFINKEKVSYLVLKRVMANTMEKFHLHKEVQQAKAKMAELHTTDTLTGVCSRQHFFDVLEIEFERAKRYESDLALLLLDLDGFATINDSFGRTTGDTVIIEIGKILQQYKRLNDQVCRYSGNEFAMILPSIDTANALIVAEKFRQLVASRSFEHGDNKFSVTVSAGIASSQNAVTSEELIRQGKQALNKAKKLGKNRVSA